MSYLDGFLVPVPQNAKEAYRTMAEKMAGKLKDQGALAVTEAWGDDLQHGKVTDFFLAVKAEPQENVVFSYVLWPSKAVRDAAWEKIMADPEMQPGSEPMPFDGKRMFWGGFEPIVETAKAKATETA
jgi:uncharacterized protein YbaA (DUF1428 family)